MSFPGWCVYRAHEARRRADDAYRAILRRRCAREAQAAKARAWAAVDDRIAKDFAFWEAQLAE